MSFEDLHPSATPLPQAAPPNLQGTLKALSANNHALHRTTIQLSNPDRTTHPPLSQIRQLREQNRDIARFAATLFARAEDPALREEFHRLVQQFSSALQGSVAAERQALRTGEAGVAMQTEVEGEEVESGERVPLLARRTRGERAVAREIEGNDVLVRERGEVLEEIQASVQDVNLIFNDLAGMIGEQREQVEYVEVAVEEAAVNVGRGRQELLITQRRREGRRKLFFAGLLSAALVIAVLLVVLISV